MTVNPAIRNWLKQQGVPLDDNGLPIVMTKAGPAKQCSRCGNLAEMPPRACGMMQGQVFDEIIVCYDCRLMQFTNPAEFWHNGWQGLLGD